MIIKKLTCKNFRNFCNISFFPSDSVNVIFGNNAEGKTNLLEAIWLFCGAKSFRGTKDAELLKFNEQKAENEIEYYFGDILKKSKIIIEQKRTAEISGKTVSPGTLAGSFYCVVFSPLDLNIINDGPAVRRKFLDTAIGQIYPLYNLKLRKYHQAVKQRNTLLRDINFHPDIEPLLDDFEKSLASSVFEIQKYRRRYIEILKKAAISIYDGISKEKEKLNISYFSEVKEGLNISEIQNLLFLKRKEDIITGNTSIGPHRDDILIFLNDKMIKSYGSQGQKRSAAISLKLAEANVLKDITGEYPVVLLDDVMSELDKERQSFILNNIKNWQVFITCCDPSNINGLEKGKVFKMKNGNID